MKTKFATRSLSILLVLVMLLAFVPFAALSTLAAEPELEITEVSSFPQLLAAVNGDKTYIKLTGHIIDDVPETEIPTLHRLVFDGGKDYTLDLGGYLLCVSNTCNEFYTDNHSMIEVSKDSNLKIKDGRLEFENYYNNNRVNKGVVSVADTSTLVAENVSMRNYQTGTVVYASETADVTINGGEYTVQNGFALYMTGAANLTLDGGVYVHTVMGDSAETVFAPGYGALFSNSTGELNINYALFKSGIQIGKTQKDAFSIANHAIVINGENLTEEIFDGTQYEASQANKPYYWYDWTSLALKKTEGSNFCLTVSVISTEKKYPIDVKSGTAYVGSTPVTEASYGQVVTITADAPEAGKEFVRWDTSGVPLVDHYSATTTFEMVPAPVTLAVYYGNESISTVDLTIPAPQAGALPTFAATSNLSNATTHTVEWFVVGQGGNLDKTSIFYPGVQYGVRILVYPASDYKFANTVSPVVNGKPATIQNGTSAFQVVEYHFDALPAPAFMVYYKSNPQLGVGGKLELDIDAIKNASDSFADALDADKVTYQWYKDGMPIEGATASEYAFAPEDIGCRIHAVVTADGISAYGDYFTCTGDLFHVYFTMSTPTAGGYLPQVNSATPGVFVGTGSLAFYEKLGDNSFGDPLDLANAILLPGKTYRLVLLYGTSDPEITVGINASFYVNGEEATKDGYRLIYDFTTPAADFAVSAECEDKIGIGAELVATEVAGATYQWYRNGKPIKNATNRTYLVGANDKDSLLHCVVTKSDGTRGFTEQVSIGKVITVLRFEVTTPQNNTTKSAISISVNVGTISLKGWMPGTIENCGNFMNDEQFVEGDSYVGYFQVTAPDGLWFTNGVVQTKGYCNKTMAGEPGGFAANGTTAAFMFEFTAAHKHEYSDTVWAHDDEGGHWQPCILQGCANPNEEWMMYTPHWGGGATCKTQGICGQCGAAYYAEHDVAVPEYLYVDEMHCADYCATEGCDYISDLTYHMGGVATCSSKAICELCHHEYGEVLAHAGGTATCTEQATCTACGEKYGTTLQHTYDTTEWGYKGTDGHAHVCACGAHEAPTAHTPDRQAATEDDPVKCCVCGYIIEDAVGHVTHIPANTWEKDGTHHWHECTKCAGQQLDKATHADTNNDGLCDTCQYRMRTPTSITANYTGTIFAGNKINPSGISITLHFDDSSNTPVNVGNVEYWYNGSQIQDPINYVFGVELIGTVNITVKYQGLETTMAVTVVGHEITFNANTGSGTMQSVQYVGTYTLPTCTFTAPTGKQFKGWSTSANGDVLGATYSVTANVAFFAIWEDIPVVKYDVTFNANGGTGTMSPVEFAGTYTLPACGFTAPTGKQFKGWATSANGTVINGTTYNVTADVELFAIWEDASVTPPPSHTHDFGTAWESDANEHWHACACGDKANTAAHTDTNGDGKCDTCQYQMSTPSSSSSSSSGNTEPPTSSSSTTSGEPSGEPSGDPQPAPPQSTNEGSIGTGAVVGIVCGSTAVVGIGGFAIFWFVIKKKTWAEFLSIFKK